MDWKKSLDIRRYTKGLNQRKLRRKAERNKNKSEENMILFEELRTETTNMANLKKKLYYKSLLERSQNDVKSLYKIVNREFDRKQNTPLPESDDVLKLCSDFNNYFNNKILKLMSVLVFVCPTDVKFKKINMSTLTGPKIDIIVFFADLMSLNEL